MTLVIDASAVLAVLRDETGADVVVASAESALLSAVNLAEILAKASDLAMDVGVVRGLLDRLRLRIEPFDNAQAVIAAQLRSATRHLNISQADRACMALAISRQLPLLTGDRDWAQLNLGVDVRLFR